jgi:hypothetical protein
MTFYENLQTYPKFDQIYLDKDKGNLNYTIIQKLNIKSCKLWVSELEP